MIYFRNSNPWCRDIWIDGNNLQCLPNNESVFQQVLYCQGKLQLSFNLVNENDDQNALCDNIYESGFPTVTFNAIAKQWAACWKFWKKMPDLWILPLKILSYYYYIIT